MSFSVALVKYCTDFGLIDMFFNQSECRNVCLYNIIQKIAPQAKSGKFFQIWFSPDLGKGGEAEGNDGVLSMRM